MIGKNAKVGVIGAGLAGSEASYFLAKAGVSVILFESKRIAPNPAQKLKDFAELVCTNSLKSMDEKSPHGLLKAEMKGLGSLILEAAHKNAVPAGDALAVERLNFSKYVTDTLSGHPQVTIVDADISNPLELKEKYQLDYLIIATGPLTNSGLADWIKKEIAADDFYFYDAIAPIVDADTLDYSKLYFKDRHKDPSASADYLNSPLDKAQYERFVQALIEAEKVPSQNFEEYRFFESCLPVDLMAERGPETLRFSCMKPIGLETVMPDGRKPWAVVQLRKENLLGSAFNMVGFQTRLKYSEQVRIFRMLPGFEQASFLHLGSVHRNSYLNARELLNYDLSSKKYNFIHFAGQITGVEGYTESSAMGLYVAFQVLRKIQGKEFLPFPVETGIGALVNYIITHPKPTPSNINLGLLPPVELDPKQKKGDKKALKKELISQRAKESFQNFQRLW